ncbi:MAG: glycosyltransferase [Actinomycetota bacterium]|nr:glycosyltransferase [Actinomycetota bacterium]
MTAPRPRRHDPLPARPEDPPARASGAARRAVVLHLLPDLRVGGGQTIVLQHVRHADGTRFEVDVCHLFPEDELGSAFREAGADPVCLDHRQGREVRTLRRLVGLIRRRDVDLLHVHSGPDRKLGQLAALLTGTPVVCHLHASWIHFGPRVPSRDTPLQRLRALAFGRLRDQVERRTVRRYVAGSQEVHDLYAPLLPGQVSLLRQSVAVDAFAAAAGGAESLRAELGLQDAEPLLVNVSRLAPGKGHDALVAMLTALKQTWPRATLLLVGDGERRPQIEALVASRDLQERVRFLGSRLDVPDLLALADVFVFASESEGFGLAVLEAMAAGKPVVAFRVPALEEFVENGKTGILVDPQDLEGFVAAVEGLLAARVHASALGAAARRGVMERFPPTALARSLEDVYDEMLASRRGRPARPAPEAGRSAA